MGINIKNESVFVFGIYPGCTKHLVYNQSHSPLVSLTFGLPLTSLSWTREKTKYFEMDERKYFEMSGNFYLGWEKKAPFQAHFLQEQSGSYFTDLSAHWLELGFLYIFSEGIPDYRIRISGFPKVQLIHKIQAKVGKPTEVGFLEDGVAAEFPHSPHLWHPPHFHPGIRSTGPVQQDIILVVEVEFGTDISAAVWV